MGPLQARPAHRPYPRRRSAGHQCRPMGDRRRARLGIFLGAERGRPPLAHPVHGRRLQAGDLRLPGHRPAQFDAFRQTVTERAAAASDAAHDSEGWAREFRDLSIDASFRSSPPILQLVDAVIDEVGHDAMGLKRRPNPPRRGACRPPRRSAVVAALLAAASRRGGRGRRGGLGRRARPPLRRRARAPDPPWLDEAAPLASTERPLCAGDILVLVRSRTALASLLVARLYAHDVPVAGIDRLHLSKPLAVKDLLAAIGFAVQPHDDLNLAGLLVSPIIGLDQDQLLELSYNRRGSLWRACRRAATRPEINPVFVILATSSKAPTTSPRRVSSKISSRAPPTPAASCSNGSARRRATRSRSWSPARSNSKRRKAPRSIASSPGSPAARSR